MSSYTYPIIPTDVRGVFHIVLHAKWPNHRAPFGAAVDDEFVPSSVGEVVYQVIGEYLMTDRNCRLYAVNLVPNRLHLVLGLCGEGASVRSVVMRVKAPVTRRIRREVGWGTKEDLWRPGAFVERARNLPQLERLLTTVKRQLDRDSWWPSGDNSSHPC